MKGGGSVNDDAGLEQEADQMGGKAAAGVAQATTEGAKPSSMLPVVVNSDFSSSTIQLVVDGYKPGRTLQPTDTVMQDLTPSQQQHLQVLHDSSQILTRDEARTEVGASPMSSKSSGHSPPFPFRYASAGPDLMSVRSNGPGGLVQYPQAGLPERHGEDTQISLVAGSQYQDLQQGSKRARTQSQVMDKVSPNEAAQALKLGPGAWEWLHLVAFSIKLTHVDSLTAQSLALIQQTNQPQQIRENLVLGSAGANTAMLTYETFIKSVLREHPTWSLDLFVAASVESRHFDGRVIPVATRINFDFQFCTEDGKVTPPVVLAFNPLDTAAPTLAEYSQVVEMLKKFVSQHATQINGFEGLRTKGFDKV